MLGIEPGSNNLENQGPPEALDLTEHFQVGKPNGENKSQTKQKTNATVPKESKISPQYLLSILSTIKSSTLWLLYKFGENLGTIMALIIFATAVIGAIFYVGNGKPLASTVLAQDSRQIEDGYKPIFITFGQYNGQLFSFSSKSGQMVVFDPATKKEQPVVVLPRFDNYLWHTSGKLLIVSTDVNPLGNLYLYDVTNTPPKQTLLTPRDQSPGFSEISQVNHNLALAWSPDGQLIAFTAENLKETDKELYLFGQNAAQPLELVHQNAQEITNLIWITNSVTSTLQFSFVAVEKGQEKQYWFDPSNNEKVEWRVN